MSLNAINIDNEILVDLSDYGKRQGFVYTITSSSSPEFEAGIADVVGEVYCNAVEGVEIEEITDHRSIWCNVSTKVAKLFKCGTPREHMT